MSEVTLRVGDQAPDFCLLDQYENEICLKDQLGKWVVVYFYPKDNTPGCTIEATNFTARRQDYVKLDAQIFGISADSCRSHVSFMEKRGLTITLLSDEEKNVIKAYGVWKPKKFMGREFLGIVRTTFLIGPEGEIRHIWPEVKVKGHVDEVFKRLQDLKGG